MVFYFREGVIITIQTRCHRIRRRNLTLIHVCGDICMKDPGRCLEFVVSVMLAFCYQASAGITFFLKLSKKMKSKKMRFLRKWFSKKMVSSSKKMDLGDFLPRSGAVTELRSRRTCVRSFFFVATLSRDVH